MTEHEVASESTREAVGQLILDTLVTWLPIIEHINPWVFFTVTLLAAYFLSEAMAWFLKVVIRPFTERTKSKIDDILLKRLQHPIAWIIFSVLAYVAFAPTVFPSFIAPIIEALLIGFNIFVIAYLLNNLATAILEIWALKKNGRRGSSFTENVLPIFSKVVKALIWAISFLLFLASFGVQIGPFLTGLGLAGIVLGLALQDSLKNIFGGISLAFDQAYRKGDKIRLEDGTIGTVYDISLRSTRIQTYDGDLIMIPNGKIANEHIYTFAQPLPKSRVSVEFGIEYGSDTKKAKEIVLKALETIEGIEKEPAPAVIFDAMGAYSLDMKARFWVEDYTQAFPKKLEVTQLIYDTLQKHKIGIAFPTQTIHVKK